MDSARFKTDRPTEVGPATPAGKVGFGVLVLCFCAAIIMLTIKLGVVLFN